ncbi:MAG: lipocalin-like domain-containing protein [Pseudomonadota bacterium]
MIVRIVLVLTVLFPVAVFAQGFAGLGTDADGFSIPQPGKEFVFPRDHGAHADFRIEWWYLTANLESADGTQYGLQWTLFRSALQPTDTNDWQSPQIWFAHAAVTTPYAHFATERFARGGIGQAGVEVTPFHAWIDDWHLKGPDFHNLSMTASGPNFGYDMQLSAQGPLIFQGDRGFSVKSSSGQASYYYSQPFYEIEGTLRLPDGDIEVTGEAWLDREWSSQPLADNQIGWDWFSLSFDTGEKMMGFQLRETGGISYTAATWIMPDGTTEAFPDGAFQAEPLTVSDVADRKVPTRWRVTLAEKDVDVTVEAMNPQSWMNLSIPYWEGPVIVSGSKSGRGYLEMTGYE